MDKIPVWQKERPIQGMSAVLLPFQAGQIDWDSFRAHFARTQAAGLIPAVNMDTGYGPLLPLSERLQVLKISHSLAGGKPYVAGALVQDQPGASFAYGEYAHQCELIQQHGGLPILFPSFGLVEQSDSDIVESYRAIAACTDRFLAFELGKQFAPFGCIYSEAMFEGLLEIPACIGIKHSSLRRDLEWQRLAVKDRLRPDFLLLTGNDLAIDMVFYGSDYLLGLSTFAPDLFALRDRWWRDGDPRAVMLNDDLQYLGAITFRPPVPAYKHSAAMFLKLRGWIASDEPFPGSLTRPETDRPILEEIRQRLEKWLGEGVN